MVIIYLNDGLGNQMFQFALFRKLQSMGKEVKIYDLDLRKRNAIHNGLEIESIFGLEYPKQSKREFRPYDTKNLCNHIIRKLFYEKKYPCYEEKNLSYKENVLQMDNICLKGYWQSERYFKDIQENIKEDFTFLPFQDELNIKVLADIKSVNSVAVHIRRGDYLNRKYKNSFGNICNIEYYLNAMQYFDNKFDNIKYFVFSNDISWCKHVFSKKNMVFVDHNGGKNSYLDMQLMKNCNHQIIANSSFSWWAAWLNENPQKIVIAPEKWINGENVKDIWCSSWIKMKGSNR